MTSADALQSPTELYPPLANPLASHWADLFHAFDSLSGSWLQLGVLTREDFVEDQVSPVLDGSADPTLTSLPVQSTAERFLAFEDSLSRLTVTAYSLVLGSLLTPSSSDSDPGVWVPLNVTVYATRPQVAAYLRVGGIQVAIGILSVIALGLCIVMSAHQVRSADQPDDSIMISGGTLDCIVMMHRSSLPHEMTLGGEIRNRDTQRRRAESIVATCVDKRRNTNCGADFGINQLY